MNNKPRTKAELRVGMNRLRVLADHLKEKVPSSKKKFNMWRWVKEENEYDRHTDASILREVKDNECGTAACAFGHAASIPSFRKAGLRYTFNISRDPHIAYKDKEDFAAAEKFFKLTFNEADTLFSPFSYHGYGGKNIPKSVVVRRIEAMVKKFEKELQTLNKK